mgnify:CR=1 FL=1
MKALRSIREVRSILRHKPGFMNHVFTNAIKFSKKRNRSIHLKEENMKQYVNAALLMMFCVVVCIHSLPVWAAAPEEPLVVRTRSLRGTSSDYDETKEYKYQLLQLILEKTQETDGPFKIETQKYDQRSR